MRANNLRMIRRILLRLWFQSQWAQTTHTHTTHNTDTHTHTRTNTQIAEIKQASGPLHQCCHCPTTKKWCHHWLSGSPTQKGGGAYWHIYVPVRSTASFWSLRFTLRPALTLLQPTPADEVLLRRSGFVDIIRVIKLRYADTSIQLPQLINPKNNYWCASADLVRGHVGPRTGRTGWN